VIEELALGWVNQQLEVAQKIHIWDKMIHCQQEEQPDEILSLKPKLDAAVTPAGYLHSCWS
jgi:hypothetical protein